MNVTDQVVLISGANQGFGLAVAEHFLKAGAKVSLCARDLKKFEEAKPHLLKSAKLDAFLISSVDIAKEEDVKQWVAETVRHFGKIDVLVANAGVYGPKGPIEHIDYQAWSEAIDINLKGVFLQVQAVVPLFKKQKQGSIIVLSGGGATKPMPLITAYAASKAGVVRFAESMAEELRPFNIRVNSIAPGALNTRLLGEILEAGPEKVGAQFYEQALKQQETGGAPLESGAKLCLYLASSESTHVTGKLISAVWDPWAEFSAHETELRSTDIYTLRRILPKDRGMSWGDV